MRAGRAVPIREDFTIGQIMQHCGVTAKTRICHCEDSPPAVAETKQSQVFVIMPTVEFSPSGITVEIAADETILDAAIKAELSFANACSGNGVCGGCRIRIIEGHKNLPEPSAIEANLIQKYNFNPDERAACQTKPFGDVKVTTSYW